MKVSYTNISDIKILRFIRNSYWFAAPFGILIAMYIFPPNMLNPNKIEGEIINTFKCESIGKVTGKTSIKFEEFALMLADSTYYTVNLIGKYSFLSNLELINKKAKIKFVRTDSTKMITKLEVDGKILVDENKVLVIIFYIILLWVMYGGYNNIKKFLNHQQV